MTVPTGRVVSMLQATRPLLLNRAWGHRVLPRQLTGGQASTAAVRSRAPAAAVDPGSQGCSLVGRCPAVHAVYAVPCRMLTTAGRAAEVMSWMAGAAGCSGAAALDPAEVAPVRSARHMPPSLQVTCIHAQTTTSLHPRQH